MAGQRLKHALSEIVSRAKRMGEGFILHECEGPVALPPPLLTRSGFTLLDSRRECIRFVFSELGFPIRFNSFF